ncbi:MAG: hypothetical protein ACYS21_10750, partial [Planctomycetota bacterium]
MGITIRGGYTRGLAGADGRFGILVPVPFDPIDPTDPNNSPPRAEEGRDSPVSDSYGGAILCEGASPTIKYCVITGNVASGGQGGDGAFGQFGTWFYWRPDPNDPNLPDPNDSLQSVDDGQWGGHGRDGYGNGYGGAIACLNASNPTITECIITDNIARGGTGGIGGWGGWALFVVPLPPPFLGHESGSGRGGDGYGDGFGGAIFCDGGSNPIVTNCILSNNTATQGAGGMPGGRGLGNLYTVFPDMSDPPPSPLDGTPGMGFPSFLNEIAGGAAYYSTGSDPNFASCQFTNNRAMSTSLMGIVFPFVTTTYTRGGALYSEPYNNVILNDCNFVTNLGGAVYCESGCVLDIDRCLFHYNSINDSGGAIRVVDDGFVDINDCTFSGNSALGPGGALDCQSDANITNSTFTANRASGDGGAINAYCSLDPNTVLTFDVNSCVFSGNVATSWGGGVHLRKFFASFTNCYFVANTAISGGALHVRQGAVVVTGGVMFRNKATGGDGLDIGGALACANTSAAIQNC